MGPRRAADLFLLRHEDAPRYRVTLYGSLAATGKGHLTDRVLEVSVDDETGRAIVEQRDGGRVPGETLASLEV